MAARLFKFVIASLVLSCFAQHSFAAPLTRSEYEQNRQTHGVVLFDVDWGRYWSCGGYQNAQLTELGFDRLPLADGNANAPPAELLTGATFSLFDKQGLQNRALLVQPGEYALTHFSIRVARSVDQVGYQRAGRVDLVRDGVAVAGTFKVAAGEVVYIGNFKLECSPPLALWRFYTVGKPGFARHLEEYRASYPFAELDKAQYRLFETQTMGRPYVLQ